MTVAVVGTVEPVRSNLSASMAPSASSSSAPPSDSIAPDTLQKIDALFALLPRIDPLLPLTPKLLTRLRSLANVHSVAATFADTLAVLKAETERLGEGEKDLQEMLAGLEGSMAGNETKVKGNLDALDERIAGLVARLDQIGL
jgi:nuclear migration protein JNM1